MKWSFLWKYTATTLVKSDSTYVWVEIGLLKQYYIMHNIIAPQNI